MIHDNIENIYLSYNWLKHSAVAESVDFCTFTFERISVKPLSLFGITLPLEFFTNYTFNNTINKTKKDTEPEKNSMGNRDNFSFSKSNIALLNKSFCTIKINISENTLRCGPTWNAALGLPPLYNYKNNSHLPHFLCGFLNCRNVGLLA